MPMRLAAVCIFVAILLSSAEAAEKTPTRTPLPEPLGGWETLQADLAAVRERVEEDLLAEVASAEDIRVWIASMAEDGHWPDIDYRDKRRAGWASIEHVERILAMAKAWKAGAGWMQGDANLKIALDKALSHWIANDYRCPNWFPNTITVPRALAQTMLILEDGLASEMSEKTLAIVRRGGLTGTGANLMWLAEVNILRACLENRPDLAAECFRRVAEEIRISPLEGVQADFSFHQHGRQFYSGSYGVGFSSTAAKFAALARGTAFDLSDEKRDILIRHMLDGQQWMVWNGLFDYSACGRSIANPDLAGGLARLVQACDSMALVCPERQAEFGAFSRRLRGDRDEAPLNGNRSFWRSDYMVHRRPSFMASVRMTSPRIVQNEIVNGQNLLGVHIADGVMYAYRSGAEYAGIFPVWNWRRLPGITSEQKAEPPEIAKTNIRLGQRDFSGGVSDGMYGLAAMDFARGPLSARKARLFLDREIVCLGAGIANTSDTLVCTTVNQCLSNGPVFVSESAKASVALESDWRLPSSCWVYHDGIGYVFHEQNGLRAKTETKTGSWGDINVNAPKDQVSADVFSLWLDHGVHPAGAAYHYAVAPGLALEEMDAYAKSPPYVVLSNTPACQAIWSAEAGVLAAAFYEPGSAAAPGVARFSVDQPCLLLARREPPRMGGTAEDVWFVSVSNPACQPLDVAVAIDLEAPAPAASARLLFNLPDGLYAGQSVAQAFREQ